MRRRIAKFAIAASLACGSTVAFADDPTGVLLQERHQLPPSNGPVPAFSDWGPCQAGQTQMAFPNAQGYRCVRMR